VPNWKKIITPSKLAVLAALGFEEPGPRSPNYSQIIPGTAGASIDLAANIAALALYEVYGARNLADAGVTLGLPAEQPFATRLGSFRAGNLAAIEPEICSPDEINN